MRRPSPWVVADPRPAVRPQVGPAAAVVRTPAAGDARIPDAAVGGFVAPVAVAIERRGVGPHFIGQVLRRRTEPLVAPHLGPAIERVECRGVRDEGVGRAPPRRARRPARRRAAACARRRWRVRARPRMTDEFQLAAARRVQQRNAVLAGLVDQRPAVRAVDAVADRRAAARGSTAGSVLRSAGRVRRTAGR